MPVIEVPANATFASTVTIEDFPEKVDVEEKNGRGEAAVTQRDFERSCKGALYLRPGVKVVTADELAHLAKVAPQLHRQLRVVALSEKERAEVKGEPAAPAPPPTTTPTKKKSEAVEK